MRHGKPRTKSEAIWRYSLGLGLFGAGVAVGSFAVWGWVFRDKESWLALQVAVGALGLFGALLGLISLGRKVNDSAKGLAGGKANIIQNVIRHFHLQKVLRESELKYSTIVTRASEGIVVIQQDRLVFVNEAFCRMVDYPESELMDKDFAVFLLPKDREAMRDRARRRIAGEDIPNKYELTVLDKRGKEKIAIITGTHIEYEGKPADLVLLTDITERKRMEDRLHAQETKYRSIVENMQDVFFRTDMEGNLVMANPKALELLGYNSLEEILGLNVVYTFNMDPAQTEKFIRFLRQREVIHNSETTLKRKDGIVLVVLLSVALFYDREGHPAGAEGTIRDITKWKEMQQRLLEKEKNYRMVVEGAMDGVLVVDGELQVRDANSRMVELINCYSHKNLIGQVFVELVAPDYRETMEICVQNHIEGNSFSSICEGAILDRKGEVIPVEVNGGATDYDGDRVAVMFVRDITERKARETRLKQKEQELQEKNQKLEEAVIRDSLTGLFNHRHIHDLLVQEMNVAAQKGYPLSIIMLDIDFFKRINDTYGHKVGDGVLVDITSMIQKALREGDHLGRYGGEEFLAVLPDTSLNHAVILADKIREYVIQAEFAQLPERLSISAGVALYEGEPIHRYIDKADALLYQAKDSGRNRVIAKSQESLSAKRVTS